MSKRVIRLISCITTVLMMFTCFTAYTEDNALMAVTWENIIIEAENGILSGGFDKILSKGASGGFAVASQSNSADSTASYSFDIPAETVCYLWVRAQSPNTGSDTSNISVDGGKHIVFYLKPSADYSWRRINLGTLAAGMHTLTIQAKKAGQRFDEFIITCDKSYEPKGKVAAEEKSATDTNVQNITYLPANTKIEKEKLPVMRENNGSFFVEAEDGALISPMEIYTDETASNEKYISVPGTSRFTEPYSTVIPHAGYKFYVKEKGQYHVWVRYFTPASNKKSSWIGIDRQGYYQLDTSITPEWTWKKTHTLYLDVGVHSLDIKYRESGHMLDCFIITNSNYTPSGLGSLPGEELRPATLPYAERIIPRIHFNGITMESNVRGEKAGTTYLMPFAQLAEAFGATFTETKEYAIIFKGRDYIKVFDGERKVIINGEERKAGAPSKKVAIKSWLVDFKLLCDLFGGTYTIDENNQIYITYNGRYEDEEITPENANSEEITIEDIGAHGATFSVDCSNPDAVVMAWYKNVGEHGFVRNQPQYSWVRMFNPRFVNGKFYGSFSTTYNERQKFIIKVKVFDGPEVKTYYKYLQTIKIEDDYPDVYSFVPHEKGLYVIPTFENASVYLDYTDENYECDLKFREKGSTVWRQAYPPYKDKPIKQFRGSVTGLKENTTYEFLATLSINGTAVETYTTEVTTWAENPPIAKEYKLSEIYDPNEFEGALSLEQLKGTPDGWIKIKGTESDNTISASYNVHDALYIANSEYVILEDLYIRGGYINAVHIANNAQHIRLINCDISEWGRQGIRSPKSGLYLDNKGNTINHDAGIRISEVKNIVVERCYIHDPVGDTNHWAYGHPEGPSAMFVRSRGGLVVRYNDFIAADGHRWNDAIEGYYNGEKTGGPSRDADFYGNVLQYGQDDGIELDGGQMNVRFYNNKIEGFLCGISTVPFMVGPSYMWKNLIINLGTETGGTGSAFKSGGGSGTLYSYSRMYLFNNTIYTDGHAIGQGGFGTPPNTFIYTTRNNIFMASNHSINDTVYVKESDYDYDLLSKKDGSPATYFYTENQEKHGVFEAATFKSVADGLYMAEGAGVDKGAVVPNFMDDYEGAAPDIGAFELGKDNRKSIPARPVDIWADKYSVTLPAGKQQAEVVMNIGDVPEGTKFSIRYSRHIADWMSVTTEDGATEGVLKPNSQVKLIVKTDSSFINFIRGRGAFIFKTEDGYSVPVTVYAEVK